VNQTKRISLAVAALAATVLMLAASSSAGTVPTHRPMMMPDTQHVGAAAIQPPPVCCAPTGPPVAGEPAPVNMAYFGGHVQVTPKIYLVFWGWGQSGAFDHSTAGMPANDPDGAAARMTAFVKAMGGTTWAGSQTQYYETVNGQNVYIQNPTNVFGGVWYDDKNPLHNKVSGLEIAQEAHLANDHC